MLEPTKQNTFIYLSGLWVLFKRWWPFGEPIRILSMSEIQNRLAYVCCVNQLETVKQAPYCFYVKLPIESFAIFDFSLFDRAVVRLRHVICNFGVSAVPGRVTKTVYGWNTDSGQGFVTFR